MNNIIVYKGDSECDEHFSIISYPDGQRNITLNLDMLNVKEPIMIKCRIKYFSDLEILSALIAALKRNDFYIKILQFIYLFGVRCDRSFHLGQPNYFKDVVAPVINSLQIDMVSVLWPFYPLPLNNKYLKNGESSYTHNDILNQAKNHHSVIIAGDESARSFEYHTDTWFKKERTVSGNIKISLPKLSPYLEGLILKHKKILIVDDLCDGGATFIEAAKYLNKKFPAATLNLFIYHGLFTKGVDKLLEYYDKIYCTNSYQDISHHGIHQIEVI